MTISSSKVGASGEVWKGGTLGGTVFYSPEYTGNHWEVWTFEVNFAQVLPKVGVVTPTVSVLYGYSDFQDFGNQSYAYWNAGLTLAFHDRWSLDLRYWDSDERAAWRHMVPLARRPVRGDDQVHLLSSGA